MAASYFQSGRRRSDASSGSMLGRRRSEASEPLKIVLPEAGTAEMTEAFNEAMYALEKDASSEVLQKLELRMKREIMRLEKEVKRAETIYEMHKRKMAERDAAAAENQN